MFSYFPKLNIKSVSSLNFSSSRLTEFLFNVESRLFWDAYDQCEVFTLVPWSSIFDDWKIKKTWNVIGTKEICCLSFCPLFCLVLIQQTELVFVGLHELGVAHWAYGICFLLKDGIVICAVCNICLSAFSISVNKIFFVVPLCRFLTKMWLQNFENSYVKSHFQYHAPVCFGNTYVTFHFQYHDQFFSFYYI